MPHTNNTRIERRPRRLRWLTVAAITAALAMASGAAAAGAQTSTESPVDVAVASYASDFSVTQGEALRRLDRIEPMQQVLASIREIESTRLAGWGIDHRGAFKGWVWLTGDHPAGAKAAAIADAHADIEIRTGAAHTLTQLNAAQTGLFSGDLSDGPAKVERIATFTDIDMAQNTIQIGIDPNLEPATPGSPRRAPVTDEELKAKIAEATRQLQDHINVSFAVVDGRDIAPQASFGGGQTMGGCTSGFAVRKNGRGPYGIITAGHCKDGSLSMHGISLPYVFSWDSPNADAQFHSIPHGSSHELRDDYRCNVHRRAAWCDVIGVASRSQMFNDYICHTRKNSGTSCGTVVSITFQPRYQKACWNSQGVQVACNRTFVRVSGVLLRACRGDSGGPWYRNGIAYGIHKSGPKDNPCHKTNISVTFSAIKDVENFLGVRVLTYGSVTIR